jgi:phosphopantothenoylcysteine decarboxylase/phosphopantothenate--cysteine ligase
MMILLIITGGIGCYKSLDILRRLKEQGHSVDVILTHGARQFITPLLVEALSGRPVYTDLFAAGQESEIGHINLARRPDLIVVCPATADFMARAVHGRADDLATTALLATHAPVLMIPAMNPAMWSHIATMDNVAVLQRRGVHIMPPAWGKMACGEVGVGRLPEIQAIVFEIQRLLTPPILKGKRILITTGGTREPLDPVRFLSNQSSGKQGYALASACVLAGAEVTLITAPTTLPRPFGLAQCRDIQTAQDMFSAVMSALAKQPYDVFIGTAAVADWTVIPCVHKLKKDGSGAPPPLTFVENPDILKTVGHLTPQQNRPLLVIGFAAETQNVLENAKAKKVKKGCDWLLANDVGADGEGVFGSDHNRIIFLGQDTIQEWDRMTKDHVAQRMIMQIACYLS